MTFLTLSPAVPKDKATGTGPSGHSRAPGSPPGHGGLVHCTFESRRKPCYFFLFFFFPFNFKKLPSPGRGIM